MDSTIDYYDRNADAFDRDAARLDLEHLYQPFLELLPPAGRILDAGCGPGRDSKAFLDRGYDIVSFDASPRMVELASRRTGRPVVLARFEDLEFADEFDGIWASASLLHVPRGKLSDAFGRLLRAVKSRGIIYASFKYGTGDRIKGGRLFSDFSEDTLAEFLGQFADAEILRLWQTADIRPGRSGEAWVNVFIRKVGR